MPPNTVKTIKDLIYWQYAKLISKSAGLGINARAFQTKKFIELRDGIIKWSTTVREWEKEFDNPNVCIYCGSKENLTTEHILPTCCGGPNIPDNVIRVCKTCNSKKQGKRLYEWTGLDKKDTINRIAEGKYLKLLYSLHENNGTLDISKDKFVSELCPKCDMEKLCQKEGHANKLTVYCLEGIFGKK